MTVWLEMGTNLFRLRSGKQVVGYRKQVGSYVFFSRDDFWYNGTPFHFETEDAFIDTKDRKGRKLFVGDVVKCTIDGSDKIVRIKAIGPLGPELCCHITERNIPVEAPTLVLAASYFISLA
jgi:hypothetical protein